MGAVGVAPGEPASERPAGTEPTIEEAGAILRSRSFLALLALAAVTGIVVSFAAWGFLEGTYQLQQVLFHRLPGDLGLHGELPLWYLLAVLGAAG